jgi:Na+-driven multidrug efflux pump
MFFHSGKIITQVFIVSLGTYAIATNAIGGVLAGLSQIPANALALTLITVVGQCIGRRHIADARKLTKSILWISTGSFVLMGLLILALFRPLVAMFHPPEEIVPDIYTITLINLFAQVPLWAISFLLPAALRAAGDARFTSVTSMISMWMFRVVLGYIFGIVLGYGIVGIWVAMNIEWGVRGSVFLWRFIGQKWYSHRLVEASAGD